MKTLVLFLVLLSHSHNVNCNPVFDYITSTLSELASTFTSSLKSLSHKVRDFLAPMQAPDEESNIDTMVKKPPKINKIRKPKIQTESSLNNNMKSAPSRMSTSQLAAMHGWRVDTHVVLTTDGYLLTLYRVSPRFQNLSSKSQRTALLHHGILGSSTDWLLLGPDKSLPFLLAKEGYEVWLANARGNLYSRNHYTLNVSSAEYWKFSWQEMGEYDLPAVLDYIRRFRNSTEPIDYIGHSMGATALLVLLSTKVQYNSYFRIGILLAPLAFMTNVDGPLKFLATIAMDPPEDVLDLIGKKEFVPSGQVSDLLISEYCNGPKIFCYNPLFFISGGISEIRTWEPSFIARVLSHVSGGGSTNTILHYAQIANSRKFHKFNNVSSEFPLSQVTVPIVLLSSAGDWLSTIPDVLRLFLSIGRPIDHYIVRERNLSHTEFVLAPDADELVFNKVIDFLLNNASLKTNEVINEKL